MEWLTSSYAIAWKLEMREQAMSASLEGFGIMNLYADGMQAWLFC
jgi:hypothetical protein